jgi:hypothetical protein
MENCRRTKPPFNASIQCRVPSKGKIQHGSLTKAVVPTRQYESMKALNLRRGAASALLCKEAAAEAKFLRVTGAVSFPRHHARPFHRLFVRQYDSRKRLSPCCFDVVRIRRGQALCKRLACFGQARLNRICLGGWRRKNKRCCPQSAAC